MGSGIFFFSALLLSVASAEPTTARIELYKGSPTLFINNIPNSSMVYMTYRPNSRYFGQFGEKGVHIYSFSSTPSESGYGLAPPAWIAPDNYDYSNMDERTMMVLNSDPDAYIFPRIYLHSPRWWDEMHPDELVTIDPGDGKPVPFYLYPWRLIVMALPGRCRNRCKRVWQDLLPVRMKSSVRCPTICPVGRAL